jgi:hypothetical protein
LAKLAKAFGELQDARHLADYDAVDSEGKIGPSWASEYFDKANLIFDIWDRAKSADVARLFLAAMIFGGRWAK